MRLQLRKPFQVLNKAYARQALTESQLDAFRGALLRMISRVDEKESEAYQQTIVAGFLKETFYADGFSIDTNGVVDLVIQPESTDTRSATSVWIETRKVYAGEMITPLKNNVKSLHELILRYFEACEEAAQHAVCQLVITDVYNWFIFEEADFRRFFIDNPRLKKLYQIKLQQQKDDTFFYSETARILRELNATVPVTYLNLREAADALKRPSEQGNRLLIPLVKLFRPAHFLHLPPDNTFRSDFYSELLHIIGVQETAVKKEAIRLERLPDETRNPAALLEQTIGLLEKRNLLAAIRDVDTYGTTDEEQLFTVAFTLCVTWISRALFLKLLERKNEDASLSSSDVARMSLSALQNVSHSGDAFRSQPYADLLDETDLERQTLRLADLSDPVELPLFGQTVLSGAQPDSMSAPSYLSAFLNAYTFLFDKPAAILSAATPFVTCADVTDMLTRLSCYDGRSAGPQSVTSYLVRVALGRVVVERFNAHFGWQCDDLDALRSEIDHVDRLEANRVFNSLRIVDPAAGGGQVLTTALNELIAIKARLGILLDAGGRRLQAYDVAVVNDELVVTNDLGEPFDLADADNSESWTSGLSEKQRIQTALFLEKQILLKHCLFGAESNPAAIRIGQMRLHIEQLRNSPWPIESDLECPVIPGNALLSRFSLDFRIDSLKKNVRDKFLIDFREYTQAISDANEGFVPEQVNQYQRMLEQIDSGHQKEQSAIRTLEAKLAQSVLTFDAEEQSQPQQLQNELDGAKRVMANRQRLFAQAVEWRFVFPDVLDSHYAYVGFDVVMSQPPSIWSVDRTTYQGLLRRAFPGTYSRRSNRYALQVELGLNLLKPGGLLAYLLPQKWTKASEDAKLRNWLDTKVIEQIADFSGAPLTGEQAGWPTALIVRNAEKETESHVTPSDQVNVTLSERVEGVTSSMPVSVGFVSPTAWGFSGTHDE
ncbi:Eco57I restriction-modification methylase domain-containing protein [Spirosoma terrae]|uniref:site-specific DNA-methyltransferase (adenine-specific) n=1 Tax=Spirosoma terrae TaxID=1968276 RepID=A0A6L9LAR1_9BACT|nr:hypothetical protein [Spirosoma terrae]NDU97596.1 hypothetical protein [Spirosoma terrae]